MKKSDTSDNKQLSETQKVYIDNGIAKGLADMEAGRCMSDPDEIKADILRRFNEKKAAYLADLKKEKP